MREPNEDPIDQETPGPDRWEQERELLDDPDDVEQPFGDRTPDAASIHADVADVFEQSIDVQDEERREDSV